jgi:hypothetical protein
MRTALLFLTTVLTTVGFGGEGGDEQKALAALEKVKADITRDEKLPGRPVVAINL